MQQGTFAAAAAAHDDEDVALVDREVQVVLNDEIAISHRQVLDYDVRLWRRIGSRIAQKLTRRLRS
jgi:hypothetical protein